LTVKDDPFMTQAPRLLEVVRNKIGFKHYNVRTEKQFLIRIK